MDMVGFRLLSWGVVSTAHVYDTACLVRSASIDDIFSAGRGINFEREYLGFSEATVPPARAFATWSLGPN